MAEYSDFAKFNSNPGVFGNLNNMRSSNVKIPE